MSYRVAFVQKEAYEKLSIHYLAGALRDAGIEYDLFIQDCEEDFIFRKYYYKKGN